MPSINPYLNFNGTTEEAFNFYKSIFGGEFPVIMRYREMPDGDKVPPQHANKIMHISLPIGNNMLMGTDAVEGFGDKLVEGNNYSLSISADSKEEADRLFNALSAGGKVTMPIADAFWGDYFGSFFDKYGIQWMISYSNQRS